MNEVDRLVGKIDHLVDLHAETNTRLGQIHTDLEVLKTKHSSGEKDIVELKARVAIVEQKQIAASIWRGWILIGGGALGWLLTNAKALFTWAAGRGQ